MSHRASQEGEFCQGMHNIFSTEKLEIKPVQTYNGTFANKRAFLIGTSRKEQEIVRRLRVNGILTSTAFADLYAGFKNPAQRRKDDIKELVEFGVLEMLDIYHAEKYSVTAYKLSDGFLRLFNGNVLHLINNELGIAPAAAESVGEGETEIDDMSEDPKDNKMSTDKAIDESKMVTKPVYDPAARSRSRKKMANAQTVSLKIEKLQENEASPEDILTVEWLSLTALGRFFNNKRLTSTRYFTDTLYPMAEISNMIVGQMVIVSCRKHQDLKPRITALSDRMKNIKTGCVIFESFGQMQEKVVELYRQADIMTAKDFYYTYDMACISNPVIYSAEFIEGNNITFTPKMLRV